MSPGHPSPPAAGGRLVLALGLLFAGCAGAGAAAPGAAAPAAEMRFQEGTLVEVSSLDLELAGKNDEELFAIGTAAYAAGNDRRAAASFGRIADAYPRSPHHATALFDAGLAHERLGEWREALARFRALAAGYSGADADEAAFHAAADLWHLGELTEARGALDGLTHRADLSTSNRIRAFTEKGVVELDLGDADAAERSLARAVSLWQDEADRERLDDYHPAQALYYLGEVSRRRSQAAVLDPARPGETALAAGLERKAELLLAAQGYYLRSIRVGNRDWAVASGYRIGELYDGLHAEMTAAAAPPGLSADEERAYRDELRRRLRVLLVKAIAVYEQTLSAARRGAVENRFVEEAEASLERMKRALVDTDALPAGPEAPGPGPEGAAPGEGGGRPAPGPLGHPYPAASPSPRG